MPTQKTSKESKHEDTDVIDESPEIEEFLSKMEQKDTESLSKQTARRKIEDLLEEKRLQQQLDDDFPEFDLD